MTLIEVDQFMSSVRDCCGNTEEIKGDSFRKLKSKVVEYGKGKLRDVAIEKLTEFARILNKILYR